MEKIVIFANGKATQISSGTNLSRLIADFQLQPSAIMAEVNGTVILRKDWDKTFPIHGDRVELVRVVAGG